MSYRTRFPAAVAAAILSAAACLATLLEPQWLEFWLDESSDDGMLETLVAVVVPLVACMVFAFLARREWRRGRLEVTAAAAAKGGT